MHGTVLTFCSPLQGTLFPMCGMNLAFDRQLIGPAMYFGLMGEGQPIGRYDDMWAGWCCKVGTLQLLLLLWLHLLRGVPGSCLSSILPSACISLSPAAEGEMVGSGCFVPGILPDHVAGI